MPPLTPFPQHGRPIHLRNPIRLHPALNRRNLQKMIAAKQRPAMPAPEAQLLLGKMGSPAIVVALFVLGWSAKARVHWMVPVVALGVYGCGFILVFVSRRSSVEVVLSGIPRLIRRYQLSISTYLNVAYGAQYGASASSANRMVAYVCGVGFPLFTRQSKSTPLPLSLSLCSSKSC
jgi:hypothetical protein